MNRDRHKKKFCLWYKLVQFMADILTWFVIFSPLNMMGLFIHYVQDQINAFLKIDDNIINKYKKHTYISITNLFYITLKGRIFMLAETCIRSRKKIGWLRITNYEWRRLLPLQILYVSNNFVKELWLPLRPLAASSGWGNLILNFFLLYSFFYLFSHFLYFIKGLAVNCCSCSNYINVFY